MLTKDSFQKMNEEALRKEVLLPLLRAMGYNDVYEYHGGSGEQGKDIVCWKADDVGSRENLALVVKATQMTGKAKVDKGSAGEVQTQIRQCFGKSFIDPVSGQEQVVHRVWMVSNQKISKEAINAIESGVADPHLTRNVRYIDGDRLWEYVETYLPLSRWHYVEEVRKRVTALDSHYEPQITIAENQISVTLIEKFPGAAEEKPITVEIEWVFPTTEDADKFRTSYQKLVETGEPFSVPAEFIGKFDMPDFAKTLLGVSDLQMQSLQILPIHVSRKIAIRIDLLCDDGDTFVLDYVLLQFQHGGTKAVTLTNEEQHIPFRVKLDASLETQSINLSITAQDTPFNAVQYLDLLRFQTCFSKNAQIRIINLENGIPLFEMHQQGGTIEPPEAKLVEIISRLSVIQRATKISIMILERNITRGEERAIAEIYQIVTQGYMEEEWNGCAIVLQPDLASIEGIVNIFGDDKEGLLGLEGEETRRIFDVDIPLGRVRSIIHSAKLESLMELQQRYEELKSNIASDIASIKLQFVPGQDSKIQKQYLDWLH